MDWIKKNTDQFALAALAFVLLALSAIIILKSLWFKDSFSAIQSTPPRNNTIPAVAMDVITSAQQAVVNPAQWIPKAPLAQKSPDRSSFRIPTTSKTVDSYSSNRKAIRSESPSVG
jgi:hypothetical protein